MNLHSNSFFRNSFCFVHFNGLWVKNYKKEINIKQNSGMELFLNMIDSLRCEVMNFKIKM